MINTRSQIGKLKIRCKHKDVSACRNSLSSLLSNSSFKPSSILPAEILLIKKINDPLPGKLSSKNNRFSPDIEWQVALNNQMNDFYFNAVRPQNGIISGESQAVIFSDMAELLACYANDIINTRAWQCWCWKVIFKESQLNTNISQLLTGVFIENIKYLPAVFYELRSWRLLQPLIHILDKQDALVLSTRLAEEYALYDLLGEIKHKTRLSPDVPVHYKQNSTGQPLNENYGKNKKSTVLSSVSATGNIDSQISSYDSRFRLQALFIKYMSDEIISVDIDIENILLTGLGLILNQKPWMAGSREFQKQLVNVLGGSVFYCGNNSSDYILETPVKDNKSGELQKKFTRPVKASVDNLNAAKSDELSETSTNKYVINEGNKYNFVSDSINSKKTVNNKSKKFKSDGIAAGNGVPGSVEFNNNEQATVNNRFPPKDSQITVFSEAGITTDLGGIFYLLNLMIWLDLPGCFENKRALVSQPGPWALLEVIARSLLGENISNYQDDKIWCLLRELDGRDTADLIDINETGDYRLPEQWFNRVYSDKETWRWISVDNRLYVWSASGYMLADTFCNNDNAFQQADELLRSYLGPDRNALLTLGKKQTMPVEKKLVNNEFLKGSEIWLSHTMSFIRYRLWLACGSETDNLFLQLLECRAHIYIASSHIDLIAPVENISLAARRAGLDRNPGWLAEVGRVVLFHFDQGMIR